MKKFFLFVFISTLFISFATSAQQVTPPDPVDPILPPKPPVLRMSDREVMEREQAQAIEERRLKLKEARHRLEQAAREVAEHSARIYRDHMPDMHTIRIARGQGKGAMLGVQIVDAKDDAGNQVDGVHVVEVTPGSPAGEAGIQGGDKIVAINGQSLQWQGDDSPVTQLLDVMADVEPEEMVTLEYDRNGESNSVIVETGSNNQFRWFSNHENFDFDFDFDDKHIRELEDQMIVLKDGIKSLYHFQRQPWHDLELMALTPKLGSYFNTDKGILVVSVGEANELKLEEGDVILDIDGREPKDPGHAIRILGSYQPGETIEFNIMRDRRKRAVEYLVETLNEDVNYSTKPYQRGTKNLRLNLPNIHVTPISGGGDVQYYKLNREDSI